MPASEAQKRASKKYVKANREKFNEYINGWRENNRQNYNDYQLNLYYRRRANDYEVNARIFRRILL